jgi:branched-chain amino acid transport system substrate-binding protein
MCLIHSARLAVLITWCLLLIQFVADPTAAATQERGEILIGQLVSRTGNNPGGKDNEMGAALAAKQLNAAGGLLSGRHIRLIVADDQTQADGAVAAFQRLAREGIAAVVGTSFSNASLAVIPYADLLRVPHISTGAADAQVEPVRPFTYMTSLTGRMVAEQLLRYLQHRGVKRLAVIYDSDSQFAKNGWIKQRALLSTYGIELSNEQAVKVDSRDFTAAINGVLNSDAQAVMGWLTGPPAIGFVKQYAQTPKRPPLFMSHGVAGPAFVNTLGAAAESVTVATSLAGVAAQLPDSEIRRVALAMTQSFEKAYGHSPTQFAIDGYVAVQLIAAAIKEAKSDDPSLVQASLDRLRLLTPQGEYHYSTTDHSGLDVDDVVITEIREGKYVLTDWSKQRLGVK